MSIEIHVTTEKIDSEGRLVIANRMELDIHDYVNTKCYLLRKFLCRGNLGVEGTPAEWSPYSRDDKEDIVHQGSCRWHMIEDLEKFDYDQAFNLDGYWSDENDQPYKTYRDAFEGESRNWYDDSGAKTSWFTLLAWFKEQGVVRITVGEF